MSGFRLYDFVISNKTIDTDKVVLVNPLHTTNENYITLLIGNNGSGKSRILSNIVRSFNDEFKKQQYLSDLSGSVLSYNKHPSKVVAISNSISDKFPVDKSYRGISIGDKNGNISYRDLKYVYLGARNRMNSFSNKALMNKALDILFENYTKLETSRQYRHIFNYLNYEPIIKLQYSFPSSIFPNTNKPIKPKDLFSYFERKLGDRGYNYNYDREKILKALGDNADNICDFLNKSRIKIGSHNNNEIIVNFSEKNIYRLRDDQSSYLGNVETYEMLNILRKLNIVARYDIKVYKIGGGEFNFNEASSGEANILSTLIALIPLIQDDCLVLIDEPEISLHPLWQSKYIELIQNIFSYVTGCHIIIASHSHFLVTDLPSKSSSVIALSNKKGIITSEFIKQSTFGWSAEEILLKVFKIPTTRNYYLSEELSKIFELISEEPNKRNYEQIQKRIRNLRELDLSGLSNEDPLKDVINKLFKNFSNV